MIWIWISVIVLGVILDQVSKWLTVAFLTDGVSVNVIPGVFRFTYVENRGAAFGMLDEHRWVFMVISTLAIVGLLIYLWKFAPPSRWVGCALSLVISGGIGNMIDRVRLGYVIDMLDFCAFPKLWPWVFNVADSFVCVGGGILFVWCVVMIFKEEKNKKNKTAEDSETAEDSSES